MMKITQKGLRQMERQLCGADTVKFPAAPATFPIEKISDKIHMTDDGVVIIPGGWVHPFTVRDMVTPEAWAEFLTRPRVPSLYPVYPYPED
jgi:hypothetical protein